MGRDAHRLIFTSILACSRLRDGGGKSFSNKKCEKRVGAGERHRHRPLSQVVRILISLLISSHYIYYRVTEMAMLNSEP